MTHHEDAHQGRRPVMAGVAVLVVSSGVVVGTGPPQPASQRRIGSTPLLCVTAVDPVTHTDCRVVLTTPLR